MSDLCLHCGPSTGKKGTHRRNLCQECYMNRGIREKYPSLKQGRKPDPVLNDQTGRLTRLNTYKPEAWDFCLHGLPDGECPDCEKEQRAGMVWGAPYPCKDYTPSPARILTRVFRSRYTRKELVV